jgi:hypothetical protein
MEQPDLIADNREHFPIRNIFILLEIMNAVWYTSPPLGGGDTSNAVKFFGIRPGFYIILLTFWPIISNFGGTPLLEVKFLKL